MKEILFATTNPNKRKRFQLYFDQLGINVLNLADVGVEKYVEEDGTTPLENAFKKAIAYYGEIGIPTLAIDYGLYIEKFPADKQPGLHVRRVGSGKEAASDDEMLEYYIKELNTVGGKSKGKWISSIALIDKNGNYYSANYDRATLFTSKRCKSFTPGEPLNSIQINIETGKYYAELTAEEWLNVEKAAEGRYIEFMRSHMDNL
jgi:XTP/dITP diphosphohydrolase